MKVHYKWIALLAVIATPFISTAGPITQVHDEHNDGDKHDWKTDLPKGWQLNGGPKWLGEHEGHGHHGHGHFDTILNDFFDRDPQGHHRGHHDHDRDSDDRGDKGHKGNHDYSGPPGWNHIGDRDVINTVPETTSTAMLLSGCVLGLLLLAKARKAQPALCKVSAEQRRI